MSYLPCIQLESRADPDAAVIWLHGLGANGHDFEPIVPQLNLPAAAAIRFIFPHAPEIPVTINAGYRMPAWYDILDASIDRRVDLQQLKASAAAVARLVEREIERGIDSKRIVLAGFSQGGAVAIQTALTFPKPLAGLMGLSTYFATRDTIQPVEANKTLPVRIFHGTADPMVPESIGRQGYEALLQLGYDIAYKTYPMEHNVCLEEIEDIAAWLVQILDL